MGRDLENHDELKKDISPACLRRLGFFGEIRIFFVTNDNNTMKNNKPYLPPLRELDSDSVNADENYLVEDVDKNNKIKLSDQTR